jgi:hypothetical protein
MKKALLLLALIVILVPAALVLADVVFEQTTVKTHRFLGPIDEVVVRSGSGDVELVRARGRSVVVRETQHYLFEQPTLERDVEDGVLRLEARCEARFTTCVSDLRVSVPRGAVVRIDSDSGDVEARPIDVREARLQSDSGDVRLELRGRQRLVRAHADAGDIDVVTRDAVDIDAQTDSGDVVVTTRRARDIAAKTDSGDVVVAVSGSPRRILAATDSGDVRVVVPAGEYAISAQTDSGTLDVGGISRNDRAARSIETRTDSGDVTLDGR